MPSSREPPSLSKVDGFRLGALSIVVCSYRWFHVKAVQTAVVPLNRPVGSRRSIRPQRVRVLPITDLRGSHCVCPLHVAARGCGFNRRMQQIDQIVQRGFLPPDLNGATRCGLCQTSATAKIENFWRDLTGVSSGKNDQLDESQRKEQVGNTQCNL
jgi:hypothetical protein